MKHFLLFSLLFLGFSANAQYKTLTLKSGSAYRYTKLHFVSDDTLFFKSKSDHINYKVATADLTSSFYLPYGKYHHFNSSSKNLKPLKVAMGVGLGLMLGGAGAAFLVDTDYVVLYIITFASPGALTYVISNTIYDQKKIHQQAVLAK
jgi:hypothetical protein